MTQQADTPQDKSGWQFWVDRGGTFTDLVARAPDGTLTTHKLLSENPEAYEDAALQGIRDILGLASNAPLPAAAIDAVKMGTTVATNALLERKGDATLLVVTKGFRDQLRIAYQARPRLFDKEIILPEMLYDRIEEVIERVDAKDNVLIPLNLDDLAPRLQAAFDDGIRAIAIVLMHGYRVPAHELAIAELARKIGFTQVSTSHGTSPMIKFVGRGDTTVADAYLSPILRRYIDRLARDIDQSKGAKLQLMQSNGGLTDASLFQGKDAILSGPAGGIVGAVKTAKQAGFDKVITFDMGGTSTDVAHYENAYERVFDTVVAGVRIHAPMLLIHTVAAGGGSICRFEHGRFQVGPESAGANPGPACYRRGGPLAVTDCNAMLGKLQPQYFPHLFGPNQDEALDVAPVRAGFAALAAEIEAETGIRRSEEEIASGFLRIAVENMANAIKKISVQRGYDVTEYALQCFGGAGGQHACLIADVLGMKTVLIHPFAGVLSAYGMGLADVTALRERTLEAGFDAGLMARLQRELDELAAQSEDELAGQDIASARIETHRYVHLRYDGSDTALPVPFGSIASMTADFEAAYQSRFGFLMPDKALVAATISVESIGRNFDVENNVTAASDAPLEILDHVRCFMDDQFVETPVYARSAIAAGQRIMGPALIAEATGTNVIEPGWQAEMTDIGNLVVRRVVQLAPRVAIGTSCDPVMLEVFNNLFMSIAEQMGATLANTAYSVNIKERLDFSCALFDPTGGLVANAPHVPVHLGSMSESIRTVIRLNPDMKPGDVFVLNAPFNGGTHLPDITVVTPVFNDAGTEVLFFVASRGHHADIGGRTPGSAPPDSTHIEDEGVIIDNFKMIDGGSFREAETRAILGSGRYPCRNIDDNLADLAAQVAANETGLREVNRMIAQFGLTTVHAYMRHVQDNAEECVRRVITRLSDGSFDYELDDGEYMRVAIRVDKAARSAEIDFTGTASNAFNFNAPLSVCHAVVLYVFRTLVGNAIPLNEGCFKPLKVIAPEGSMVNAQYPSAVIAGNTEVSQLACNALLGALGVMAGSQATMNNYVWGNSRIQNYETICGGTGAGSDFDGCSAVQTHMTNTRSTDPEVLEFRFPVRLEEISIRHGSGGKGANNGGDGITRRMRFLEQMTVTTLCSHRRVPPFGLNGGAPGVVGKEWIERKDGSIVAHRGVDENEVYPDDVFVMQTPSGGGFGA